MIHMQNAGSEIMNCSKHCILPDDLEKTAVLLIQQIGECINIYKAIAALILLYRLMILNRLPCC